MAWDRWLFGCDLHGDKQDKETVDAFLKFSKEWNPKYRIFGGDLFDFRPLRRRAEEDEKRQSMQEDCEAGLRFLKAWKPTHYLRGNHCERLWDLARFGSGILADYAQHGVDQISQIVRGLGCDMRQYHKRDGVLRLGDLSFLHGFAAGVYAARNTGQVYGAAVFGHIHAFDQSSIPGLTNRIAQSVGCMCDLDMDYNLRQPGTLRQAQGWAYGAVESKTGDYIVWQSRKIKGKFLAAKSLIEL